MTFALLNAKGIGLCFHFYLMLRRTNHENAAFKLKYVCPKQGPTTVRLDSYI
jgi:hypothetical protein